MGRRLDELKETICDYKDVIVYGAGTNAGPIVAWLVENDIFASVNKHVAVTKPKEDEHFRGFKVERINDMVELKQGALVLVAVFWKYFDDIDNTLNALGFEHSIHIEDWFIDEAYYETLKDEPIIDKKILVENFHGLGYGDSPKYIVKELMKQRNDLDIVWIVRPGLDAQVPEGVRTVEIYSCQFYYEVFTAKIWISNVRKYQSVKKRQGQYYIQTWHGFTLKKIEKDAEEVSHGISAPYFDAGKKDSQMIDLLISNATFLTGIYRQTFWYEGEILECGTPRNDVFFQNDKLIIDQVKTVYHIARDSKILMYAPTFRESYKDDPLDIDMEAVLNVLERKTGYKWVALMRMHPNIANKENLFVYTENVVNATWYPDVMELLYATDALITDYSSIMFDYMIKKKPIFLYAKDKERYANNDRGFYLKYDDLPFPIAVTNKELLENISDFELLTYLAKLKYFEGKMGFCDDGTSSMTIVKRINEETGG